MASTTFSIINIVNIRISSSGSSVQRIDNKLSDSWVDNMTLLRLRGMLCTVWMLMYCTHCCLCVCCGVSGACVLTVYFSVHLCVSCEELLASPTRLRHGCPSTGQIPPVPKPLCLSQVQRRIILQTNQCDVSVPCLYKHACTNSTKKTH